jgi:hypothetical protein
MKTESVLARPFFRLPLDDIDEWLNGIELRFGEDDDYAIRESVTISISARTCLPQFRIPAPPAALMESEATFGLRLTIAMSDEGRKMQKVILLTALSELQHASEIECVVPAGIDWTSPQGAILSLLVCSAERGPRSVGVPFRKSSTVAARHIGINRSAPGDDFPIHYLSDRQFKERGYHPRALAVVVITADDLDCDVQENPNIQVLVHEDLKGALALGGTSKKGRLATQIVMEAVINQIAVVAAEREYPDGSLGNRTRDRLAKRLATCSLSIDLQALRATTQGSFKLVDHLKKL